MSFKPDSTCERHQKYFDAFSIIGNGIGYRNYLNYITRFINDAAVSHLDEDDIQFFRDLLFESHYGKVHIEYYQWIIDKWIGWALDQSIFTLCKYADFLGQVSELFLHDMFDYIFKIKPNLIESVFNGLSPDNKVHFITVGMKYPKIIKGNPKFKTYLLFS